MGKEKREVKFWREERVRGKITKTRKETKIGKLRERKRKKQSFKDRKESEGKLQWQGKKGKKRKWGKLLACFYKKRWNSSGNDNNTNNNDLTMRGMVRNKRTHMSFDKLVEVFFLVIWNDDEW